MASSRFVAISSLLPLILVSLAACTGGGAPETPDTWEGVCVDQDRDGYGFQCEKGADCDDNDSSLTTECSTCSGEQEGCECPALAAPVDCKLPLELTETGSLLCKTGTRYCRDGAWTACEGIREFEAPAPSFLLSRALVDQDAGNVICDVCNPDCYRVDDPLDSDAGLSDNLTPSENGGITLSSRQLDAGTSGDGGLLDDDDCVPGAPPDTDCDGIPDDFDEYDDAPPFATDHNTIFMDLAPGETAEQSFEIQFFLNSADVYFYLDMTASMDGERDNLIASLTTGNFLPNGGTGVECADRDFDGTPDNDLKDKGIAGNIACLIRDAQLGAGYFRDIPFPGPFSNGVKVAPYDFPMYRHYQDITADVSSVLTALSRFQTRGNYNFPEGGMQGLWAIATGSEVYAGWDRPGIPARTDCPAGTWGYPCFRSDAVPIVINVTDAQMQNGPPTDSGNLSGDYCANHDCTRTYHHELNYDSNVLSSLTGGTEGAYRPLTTAATLASPEPVGVIDDVLVTYAGNLDELGADVTYSDIGSCAVGSAWNTSDEGANDAVFRFEVDTTKTLTVSTRGSYSDTTLVIKREGGPVPNLQGVSVSGNGSSATAADLGTIVSGDIKVVSGSTSSLAASYAREDMGCFDVSSEHSERTAVSKFQLASDMTLSVSTTSGYSIGTALMAGTTAPADSVNLEGIRCSGGGSDNCNDEIGDYNVGDMAGRSVLFTRGDLRGQNDDYRPGPFSGCSVNNGWEDAAIDFSLSRTTRIRAETSDGNSDSLRLRFDHALALVRRSGGSYTTVSCASDSNQRAALEEELPAGDYSILIKGNANNSRRDYRLLLRDVGYAPVPVACHNTRASSGFTVDLDARDSGGNLITYYLVTRGNTGSGDYELTVQDAALAPFACADDNAYAINDQGQRLSQEEVTTVFTPGSYLAVVKGYSSTRSDWFQLTLGDKTQQSAGSFDAKSWLGPSGDGNGGVLESLVDRGIRVISVRSSNDSYLVEQSELLATATGATDVGGDPLDFSISTDGTGMGYAVIEAVSLLSGNLSMDVGVLLQQLPDNPDPDFLFEVEAVDVAGDSCDAPIDTDGDSLPDTHVNCRPGATPQFRVAFTHRDVPNNVPLNPDDPQGGYNMQLALVGDGAYVVDRIPVYIIPEDVIPDPPTTEYAESGNYEQTISAAGCVGTEAPLWRSLYWDGTIPAGTRVTWALCAGNDDAELSTCTYRTVAEVSSGGACTVASDCPNGYCDGSGLCQFARGPACSADAECGNAGVCVDQGGGTSQCMWTKNPVDLKPAVAGGLQGKASMKVRATLEANEARTEAPTIDNWRLDYTCTAQE